MRGGVKEFNLIAQDLTYYGRDLYRKPSIARLVDRLAKIDGVEWLRLARVCPPFWQPLLLWCTLFRAPGAPFASAPLALLDAPLPPSELSLSLRRRR